MKLNIVPARQGAIWVKLGVQTFFRQPLALCGLFLMLVFMVMVLSLVPVLGNLLALAVLPGVTVGFMVASQEASANKFPKPLTLFRTFLSGPKKARAVLLTGLGYFAVLLFLLTLTTLLDGGQFAKFFLFGGDIVEVKRVFQSGDSLLALLMLAGLNIPVALVFCYAAALVHWHEIAPMKSVFFSVITLVRNFRALIVFGMVWLILFTATVFMVTLVGAIMGAGEEIMAAPLIASSMLLEAMVFTSLYFVFRDTFNLIPGESV